MAKEQNELHPADGLDDKVMDDVAGGQGLLDRTDPKEMDPIDMSGARFGPAWPTDPTGSSPRKTK